MSVSFYAFLTWQTRVGLNKTKEKNDLALTLRLLDLYVPKHVTGQHIEKQKMLIIYCIYKYPVMLMRVISKHSLPPFQSQTSKSCFLLQSISLNGLFLSHRYYIIIGCILTSLCLNSTGASIS